MHPFNAPEQEYFDYIIYRRPLGWNEFNQDGDSVPALIICCDANIGYTVFRIGHNIEIVDWFFNKEDALDFCCDLSRRDISEHELRQSERGGEDATY